jgi:hypothetical protein
LPATLTACVIARDEEKRLPDCLESLSFCDEVVVVDGGSTDRTTEIARDAGAVVIENPWPGFGAQRNVAIDAASGDWVLEVDADERVGAPLAAEIRAFLADPPDDVRMAAIPRREVFLGRALGPSIRYPRYQHRLFLRGAFRHDESRTVHEGLWPDGPTAPLAGELVHALATTLREALRDARAYARLEAEQRAPIGPAEALFGIVVRPALKFAYRLLVYGGWRDGWRGIAKISLDCWADSLAAWHRLRRGGGADGGFGQSPTRLGPVRLVGVAASPAGAAALEDWLRQAGEAGVDAALIGRGAPGGPVRARELSSSAPAALARALDAEDQVRPIDALVPAGRRERLLLKLVPRELRGAVEPIDPATPPAEARSTVQARTRGTGAGER